MDLRALGSAHTDHHRWHFLEDYFLGDKVNLIKKMGEPLTHPHRLAGPQAGWERTPSKRLTLKHN